MSVIRTTFTWTIISIRENLSCEIFLYLVIWKSFLLVQLLNYKTFQNEKNLFDKKISEKNKTEIELDLNQTGSSGKGQFDIHWFHFLLELFFSFLTWNFNRVKSIISWFGSTSGWMIQQIVSISLKVCQLKLNIQWRYRLGWKS